MSSVDSYRIKRTRFFGRKVPILCQNENGPCPLLAIGNILLLQSNISIHPDLSEISFSELTQQVAGFLLDSNPPHEDLRINANQQTQLDTVIKLLPRLQYGLDVNVRFNSIRGFEFTEEMAAFDMTGITLLHGWILDPEDKRTAAVIEGMSYNKLVENLLDFRSMTHDTADADAGKQDEAVDAVLDASGDDAVAQESRGQHADVEHVQSAHMVKGEKIQGAVPYQATNDEDVNPSLLPEPAPTAVAPTPLLAGETSVQAPVVSDSSMESAEVATALKEGQVAEEFFRETASQLTYYGLARLHREVRDRQLCVFFRNNHFSTMFKYEGKLYLLVTDLGYARESSVVWEKLDQIDGDTEYVDSEFIRSSRCSRSSTNDVPKGQHEDQDYMLALALQQEDASESGNVAAPSAHQSAPVGDEAVALALQQEERALLEHQRRTALEAQRAPVVGEGTRGPDEDRRGFQERDRRRPADSTRGNGSNCCIQ